MATDIKVYEAPTGWVAMSGGLASRANTREEAIRRHEATLRLVEQLASKWSPPTSDDLPATDTEAD